MPLGFATAQEDGTILREPVAPSYSIFPLENVQTTYGGYSGPSPANNPGPSPTSTFASSHRPVADRSSSSSTLLGEENYFSCMLPNLSNLLHFNISSEPNHFVDQTRVPAHQIRLVHMAKMAVRVLKRNSNISSSSFTSSLLAFCGFWSLRASLSLYMSVFGYTAHTHYSIRIRRECSISWLRQSVWRLVSTLQAVLRA